MNAGNRGVSESSRAVPTGLIRYWAAAREAAGTSEEPYTAETLEEAIAAAKERHGDALERVLARCAFVVDGMPATRRDPATVRLTSGGTIEVLPPFAGGASLR
jgi:molybdopterin converting factor small subunit